MEFTESLRSVGFDRAALLSGGVAEWRFSLKSTEEIESGLGGSPGQRAITYCGGGIAAAASAFAMVRAGYADVAIYPGSLEEWTKDPALPMVTGPDPG